ncbi:MAG: glucans biosynthesis glucosyltransferase MdoH [Hyphomicrobium sp.]
MTFRHSLSSDCGRPTLMIEHFDNGRRAETPASMQAMTPTGMQSNAMLARRRAVVIAINLVTWMAVLAAAARILDHDGWSVLDSAVFLALIFATPWSVLGFWNAVIGLWVLHVRKDVIADVAPFMAAGQTSAPLAGRTAVLMTLRNEQPERALERFAIVKASLDATFDAPLDVSGQGGLFAYFVLSDTSIPEIAAAEEAAVAAWRARSTDGATIVYRRRTENTGFKAGNVRDFCLNAGRDFDYMVPLDADSLMTGDAIVRLVRMMDAHPRLGIVQSLVVGMPSSSAFARIFQFGMRLGMRSYTVGQAWWTADCGPFWGHNAIVRIAPFRDHCDLPILPGAPRLGGHILSHDQVEAVLMRRAGYDVRVLPLEDGSFEENPPDALTFIGRDVRWCQGNMQYIRLLAMPGLLAMSRFQLLWAILMFVGVPAWTLLIAALPFATHAGLQSGDFPAGEAKALYLTFLLMFLAPKIAGFIDAWLTPGEVTRFGGAVRFSLSAAIEVVFAFLQGAVSTIRTSLFMAGLLLGQSIVWSGQKRDATGITWRDATIALWPQLIFGVVVLTALALLSPTVLIWSLPLTAGYVAAIPFAVLTADPRLGAWLRRHGLAAIPEDFNCPAEVAMIVGAGTSRAGPLCRGSMRETRVCEGNSAP